MRGAAARRGSRRRTLLRRGGLVLAAGAVAVAAGFAPRALRDVDAFRVRRVEVVGTRYLDPAAVVRAAGLDEASSVFDDPDALRAGVLTLPLVEDVRVRRALPATLTLEVREVAPLALVSGAELRPVDRHGRLLDLRPAGAVLDLPIVTGAELKGRQLVGPGASAVEVLARLMTRSPGLAEEVSQVVVRPSDLRVLFRDRPVEALLPRRPTPEQLTQLRLAHADLAARGELGRARRIDVRFRDQVVVSFLGTPVSFR